MTTTYLGFSILLRVSLSTKVIGCPIRLVELHASWPTHVCQKKKGGSFFFFFPSHKHKHQNEFCIF